MVFSVVCIVLDSEYEVMMSVQQNEQILNKKLTALVISAFAISLFSMLLLCDNETVVPDDVKGLIAREDAANDKCRDGVVDTYAVKRACDEREGISNKLYELGWCYGKANEAGYQKRWHQCESGSNRPNNFFKIKDESPSSLLNDFLLCARDIFIKSPHPEKALIWLGCDSMKYLNACADEMSRESRMDRGKALIVCSDQAGVLVDKLHEEIVLSRY